MIGLRALATGDALPQVKPEVMRMYNMRFCPFAQRTRMVLLYKEIPHEVVNVNLRRKPKWLFERNPFGLVPVLEYNNEIVYESSICDDYLDELYVERPLYPKDPHRKAHCRVVMAKYDKMVPSFYKLIKPDENLRLQAKETISEEMKSLEIELGDGAFFGGPQPNMIDFHVYPWFERLTALKSIVEFDILQENNLHRLQLWQKRIEKLTCVKETMQPKEWHLEFFIGLANKNPQYDIGLPQSKV
ncbi:hypothetical protein CAPTEDRAFT_157769 [Capitella teleta]|uniref:Glutathione S-transferase omega n=1 Tax=Capitella teleta TaxID=283909 RepID=R7U137_CAPTE|nr:hypothetical protein CAPTEDRAFT_157769 [Capitella teleta]|eukprot:ELT96900.1 hypothetical protein CAPTEDRAFT_157769 [Capitella teleta]